MNKPLPLAAYAELLRRWLFTSEAVEREAVLLRIDEIARHLTNRLVTQDELIAMHQEAKNVLANSLQTEGWPVAADSASAQSLQKLASGEALTPLMTLLLPLHLEQARRIKQAEEALHFSDMMRVTTLAAGVAHDFNNLLGAVIGLADLCMLDVPPDSAEARRLNGILYAARQGSALVQNLHEVGRSLPLCRLALDMDAWLKSSQPLLEASLPTNVGLSLSIVGNSRVMADPTKLAQVLTNLVKNAGYAMRQLGGQVQVILDQEGRPGEGGAARLRVIDCGEGIPAEVLPHIFAPYFTTKPQGEGTGMGLSAAHGIIRQHEGTMDVSSTPGQQTVFTVLLPLA